MVRPEMETIVAESRIERAFQSKLPPATKYLILPADLVRLFTAKDMRWEGPFKVARINKKMIFVTYCIKFKPFNICLTLPIAPKTNDGDLKHDMANIQAFVIQEGTTQFRLEILKPSDPRTKSTKCKEVMRNKMARPTNKGTF